MCFAKPTVYNIFEWRKSEELFNLVNIKAARSPGVRIRSRAQTRSLRSTHNSKPEAMSSDSEDEAPAQLSFQAAKTAVEDELHLVAEQKKNDARVAKLKRQMKQELFMAQKKLKVEKLSSSKPSTRKKPNLKVVDETPETAEDAHDKLDEPVVEQTLETPASNILSFDTKPLPSSQPKKKFYKDLNIEVATLSEVKNSRAFAALNFKEKRLAKPHRENVNMNLIHLEKLQAAGKV